MSAKYSLLVVIIVAVLLTINSIWFSPSEAQFCLHCEQSY